MFSIQNYLIGETNVVLMFFEDFDPSSLIHHLTDQEKERFFNFNHLKRKQEFIATRILRHELFGFQHIHYDEVGAPFIKGVGHISISHTDNCVGIAYSEKYKVGLDLEVIKSKILRIGHKFLSETESDDFDKNNAQSLTELWTAKETLYKLSGKKELSFQKNLVVKKIKNQFLEGTVVSENSCFNVEITLKQIGSMIMAVNSKACEK